MPREDGAKRSILFAFHGLLCRGDCLSGHGAAVRSGHRGATTVASWCAPSPNPGSHSMIRPAGVLATLPLVVIVFAAKPLARTGQLAQAPRLTVIQKEGYATLKWNTVPGATDYQIERTPV